MILAEWRTLARVVRRSTGVLEVVDSRDPENTRSRRLESMAKAMGKPLILVINKADLIPRWALEGWLEFYRSKGMKVVAVSATRGVGKGQLVKAMQEVSSQQTSVFAVAGYPKTGKSSIINMLKGYKSAPVSPVPGSPGYTKGYTIYKVAKNVYIVDTPGTIPVEGDPLQSVIRGRGPEEMSDPVRPAVLLLQTALKYNPRAVLEAYGIAETDPYKILEEIARKRSWFYKSTGDPNIDEAARQVIRDYHKAKLWFFVPPPTRPSR